MWWQLCKKQNGLEMGVYRVGESMVLAAGIPVPGVGHVNQRGVAIVLAGYP